MTDFNTTDSATQKFHAHCYCRTTTGGTNFCCQCGQAEPYKEPYDVEDWLPLIEEVYIINESS